MFTEVSFQILRSLSHWSALPKISLTERFSWHRDLKIFLVEINVQTAVVQIWLVLINASVILDSKRLKIKKDVST